MNLQNVAPHHCCTVDVELRLRVVHIINRARYRKRTANDEFFVAQE